MQYFYEDSPSADVINYKRLLHRDISVQCAFCMCVILASSGTLAVIMGVRAYRSRKLMPAGMIAALRFVVICVILY